MTSTNANFLLAAALVPDRQGQKVSAKTTSIHRVTVAFFEFLHDIMSQKKSSSLPIPPCSFFDLASVPVPTDLSVHAIDASTLNYG
jgi:hypothetical protein